MLPNFRVLARRAALFTVLALLAACQTFAQVNVLTNRYNQQRTAANISETTLTPGNVNTSDFGKLGSYSVDGIIYAQPLYVAGLTINGASHNVLFVATMHDVLYAFDADAVGSAPLWTLDFRSSTVQPAPIHIGASPSSDYTVADTFGIFGTPVIDLPNNRMFLVTHTLEQGKTEYFRLRNVNLLTGQLTSSQVITGSVPASGSYAAETFIPGSFGERAALELAGGQVWVAFGSRPPGDYIAWQGWVMTYNATTLAQTGVFVTSRTNGNGVWQSGAGPAVDSNGNFYYLTGNGGTYTPGLDLPMTLMQMNSASGLNLKNWYTPDNSNNDGNQYVPMDNLDLDLSCNGPMLLPGTNLVTFGSKTGDVFVLNTGNLGQLTSNDTQLVQFFHVGASNAPVENDADRIVGMAYWPQTNGGSLFVWPSKDTLHAYALNSNQFSQSYAGSFQLPGQPGTALAVSANGSTNGILWAPVMNVTSETNTTGEPGVLHAYNASNPGQELWNSNMVSTDNMGSLAKFVPATVVNGKVYMANSAIPGNYSAGSVTVFGLKGSAAPAFGLAASPASLAAQPGGSANTNVSIVPLNGFSGNVNLTATGLPAGASATFTSTGTAGVSTLTVSVASTTALGNYAFTVTGISGATSAVTNLALVVTNIKPGSGPISINFVGAGSGMAAAATAGVVPEFNWNQASGASGTLALVDETGTATGASATWTASNVWSLPITATSGDSQMMLGYLDPWTGNATVTVSGLPATTYGYDIYVYANGDTATATRTGSYQISGSGITSSTVTLIDSMNSVFSGTYVQANNSSGNYVKFSSINAAKFTVTGVPVSATDGTLRTPINGIQIVPRSAPIAPANNPISINFVGRGAAMAATAHAGVVPESNWNQASGASGTLALLDETGAATGATATWTASNVWSSSTTATSGDLQMMVGYLDPWTGNATVTVSGLPASTYGYDIYVYANGDTATATRTGSYQISGSGVTSSTMTLIDSMNSVFSGTYVQANNSSGNYVKFSSINAAKFTVTGTPVSSTDGYLRAPINGIQIVPRSAPIAAASNPISINFVGRGAAMAATAQAGVVPESNWNQASGASGTLALVDETGAATGASATWTASNVWSSSTTATSGDLQMMVGYLDPWTGNATVTVSGLPATTYGYDIYVYANGDTATATRTGSYQISGSGITSSTVTLIDSMNSIFSGTYVQANNSSGNYVKFSSINAAKFTVTGTPVSSTDGYLRAPINGIEIVPRTSAAQ